MRKWIVLLLILFSSGLKAQETSGQENVALPNAPLVNVAYPVVRRIVDWDEYTGRFEAVERVEIRARVSGYLERALFDDGQIVSVGTPLFVIDQRPFVIAVDAAQADLDAANAQAELAVKEAERARSLRETRAISQEEFDERLARVSETNARVRGAAADLAQAKLNFEFTTVLSPINGRVGTDLVTRGNLINGGDIGGGTLLTTVVSEDPIYFTFEISESAYLKYARLFSQGDRPSSRDDPNPVQVRLLDEIEYLHKGTMDFVDNELDATSGTLRGRAIISNSDSLLQPGQFGRLRLLGSGEYDAVMVPDSVIQSEQARKFVFVLSPDNHIGRKFLTLGAINDGLRVVKEGLSPDDLVVLNGFHRIRAGMPATKQVTEITIAN